MTRSFSDRVLGGVCGGLARATRINAWLWRIAFVVLAFASAGAFLVAYLVLWWFVPQERPSQRRRGFPLLLALGLLALAGALWAAEMQGRLLSPAGASMYLPLLAVALALAFFLRQIRLGGRA
jgi:phage shock protein PspC (stress-responsive transcriptional regulator)